MNGICGVACDGVYVNVSCGGYMLSSGCFLGRRGDVRDVRVERWRVGESDI